MLRVAVGRLSTPHGATWSPAPRTHVGQKRMVFDVRFKGGLLTALPQLRPSAP